MGSGILPRVGVIAALSVGVAPLALADEIRQVTSGTVTTSQRESGDFSLAGSGFEITGHGREGVGNHGVNGVLPGDTATIHSVWAGATSLSPVNWIVDGVAGAGVLTGRLELSGGTFVVPAMPAGSIFSLDRPFSLRPGVFLAGHLDESGETPPVFRFGITGSGIATVTIPFGPSALPGNPTIVYRFRASRPAPIPEPSSVLLLGTAVAWLLTGRRRVNRFGVH
jgi:hypothetical protein